MEPGQQSAFGHSMTPDHWPIYQQLQPPDHTGVRCAAAIGAAMRGRGSDHGEAAGRRALAMLADGTAECICTRARSRHRGR